MDEQMKENRRQYLPVSREAKIWHTIILRWVALHK